MNKCFIIGNLTRDPRSNKVTLGTQEVTVTNFAVAVNEGSGENQTTTYFNAVAWRGLGETCAKYLSKGRKVAIEGPVRIREYTGSDGKTYHYMEIRVQSLEFCGANPANRQQAQAEAAPEPNYDAPVEPTEPITNDEDDDLPF